MMTAQEIFLYIPSCISHAGPDHRQVEREDHRHGHFYVSVVHRCRTASSIFITAPRISKGRVHRGSASTGLQKDMNVNTTFPQLYTLCAALSCSPTRAAERVLELLSVKTAVKEQRQCCGLGSWTMRRNPPTHSVELRRSAGVTAPVTLTDAFHIKWLNNTKNISFNQINNNAKRKD